MPTDEPENAQVARRIMWNLIAVWKSQGRGCAGLDDDWITACGAVSLAYANGYAINREGNWVRLVQANPSVPIRIFGVDRNTGATIFEDIKYEDRAIWQPEQETLAVAPEPATIVATSTPPA